MSLAARLDRLAARVTVEWRTFAVTRGGLFAGGWPADIEPWPHGRPPAPRPAVTSTAGWCAPFEPIYRFMGGGPAAWEPWLPWFPVHPFGFPTFTAERGGIRYITPPSARSDT